MHLRELANPNPASLIESLRAFGYSLPTALADLIDNSVTAGATGIKAEFLWDGENSGITLLDDGVGMSLEQLVAALRPGSASPLDLREPRDLGRFGLGLKTASFSQCRCVTVCSKTKGGDIHRRSWDLDHVGASGEWRLLEIEDAAVEEAAAMLANLKSGTAVIWQKCDRIVSAGTRSDDDKAQRRFLELAESVSDHLSLVFHRYIEGVPPLAIFVNGNKLKPFDPFLQNEKATQLLTEESLRLHGYSMQVRPFVLPHHSKLAKNVYEKAAGTRGWTQSQGFYVYRNRRLLVAGDWLGLGLRKDEHYKLARIQVDIPNTLDSEWQIDVRKARATPPNALRDRLMSIANITRTAASNVYRYRGARLGVTDQKLVFLWDRKISHGRTRYELNREHPIIRTILTGEDCSPKSVEILLRLIEETIPVPTITIDAAENPEGQRAPFEDVNTTFLLELAGELIQSLIARGSTLDEASARIASIEPFNRLPHIVQIVAEELAT